MRKNMKVKIELEIEADSESLKQAVYEYLLQLIDDDSLEFEIEK